MKPLRKNTARALVVAASVMAVGVAVADPAGASIALGHVVSANPANFTPNVASGAVYKFVQSNGVMYAGGEFSSVSTASGVSPGGTFTRNNVVAFNPTNGVINSFASRTNGAVWALAASGGSIYIGGDFTTANGVARRGLAKVSATTGAIDTAFNANLNGSVKDAAVVSGRLIIAGTFTRQLRAVNLNSGADTGYINLPMTTNLGSNAGALQMYRFAINPAGTRLVGVGNFTTVGGQTHYRAVQINLGTTSATVNPWNYAPLRNGCSAATVPNYLRDVDFSPNGSFFVIVSTGYVPLNGQVGSSICDAAARFETNVTNPTRPTWINYTGGDTLHSVAVTDAAVYVQGHQRWLNNPQGRNSAGPGAVSRPGIGAINPTTGLANTWNPTKEGGVGGKDLYVTTRGIWVGSDTNIIGGETHRRIALMPA